MTEPSPQAVAYEVREVLAAYAREVDEAARFPVESVDALRHSGLMGLLVPRAFGGLGGDLGAMAEVAGVLAAGCLSTAMVWAMHCQQVDALVRHGSPALQEEVLPEIAAGRAYLASVTTEPGKGGHLLSALTPLDLHDGTLTLERSAPIVTGGQYADGFLITMRADEAAPAHRVTLVYAGRRQLNIDAKGDWNPLGMRGTHSVALALSGKIPAHQIVGAPGEFRSVAIDSMIPAGHLGWTACWLGAARQALSEVVGLTRSGKRPSALDPGSDLATHRLGRVRLELELVGGYLRLVLDEVRSHRVAGTSLDVPATQIHLNTLKVATAETTFRVISELMRLAGLATGYLKDSAIQLERHFRDLRSASLNNADDRLLGAIGSLSLVDRAVRLAGSDEA